MKYSPAVYAKAFWEVRPDAERFLNVVHKNGDFSRVDKIVAALEAIATHEQGGRMINLEFARETELAEKFKFKSHDHVRVAINPALVAGVRITIDGEQELDQSLQRKLNTLWHTKS